MKNKAEKWAEEVLKEYSLNADDISDEFLEFNILGSLLYKIDKDGNISRIKRFGKETEFKVKPVSIIDDKIQIDEK